MRRAMNCLTLTDPVATAPGTDTRSLSLPVLTRAILNPMTTPPLPEQIEAHRDRMWHRDEDLRVESVVDAERFIEDLGFGSHRPIFRSFDTIAARKKCEHHNDRARQNSQWKHRP